MTKVANKILENYQTKDGFNWWGIITDPKFIENPFPTLYEIAKQGPLHYDAGSDMYIVLGHKEFQQVMASKHMRRDTRLWKGGWHSEEYRNKDRVGFDLLSGNQHQMINRDGLDHRRMRKVYTPVFREKMMKNLRQMVQSECNKLLDTLKENESINFIEAVASPLPLRVMCNLFDIPSSLDDEIGRWSAAIIRLADVILSDQQKKDALEAQNNFKAYLREEIALRRNKGGDSLMDLAIKAFDDGLLNEEETLTNLMSMILAGHETTVSLLGSGLYLLLKNQEQLKKLRSNRSLMGTAIEEMLRLEPSGTMILRVAAEDYHIANMVIPQGSMVMGMIAATNLDLRRYSDPFKFDIERSPNPQQTFGGGPHYCIGAPLARLEASIVFNSLLDRYLDIQLSADAEWSLDRLNARGLAKLPVNIRAFN